MPFAQRVVSSGRVQGTHRVFAETYRSTNSAAHSHLPSLRYQTWRSCACHEPPCSAWQHRPKESHTGPPGSWKLSAHTPRQPSHNWTCDRALLKLHQAACSYVGTNQFSGTIPTQFSQLSKLFGWCAPSSAFAAQPLPVQLEADHFRTPFQLVATSPEGGCRDWSENQLDGTVPAQFSVLRNLQQL